MCKGRSLIFLAVLLLVQVTIAATPIALRPGMAASMVGPPVPPVIDTSPPDEPMKLVFIHASVGWMWLGHWLGGRDDVPAYWDISLGGNNYYVSDAPPLPGFTGHGYCDWYYIFTNEEHLQALFEYNGVMSNYDPIADPGGENEIIMIKPCFTEYPVLGAPDDPPSGNPGCNPGMNTVGNVKQVMVDILEVFRQHPDKFFVLVTAPPKPEGAMTNGENARAIANWMVNEWLDGYDVGNVMVFDLYNVLTSNGEGEGDACQEWSDPGNPESGSDVGQETGNHHRIWNGQVQHQVAYEQTYSAYCGDGHPPRQATYKATVEFVPLLNAYVNAWAGGHSLTSSKSANRGSAEYGDTVTYTISIIGTGQPITLTDPLPSDLSYVPGSVSVTPEVGMPVVEGGVLRWTGILSADVSLDITFGAVVGAVTPAVIENTAFVDDGQDVSAFSAVLIANPRNTFLPVVLTNR